MAKKPKKPTHHRDELLNQLRRIDPDIVDVVDAITPLKVTVTEKDIEEAQRMEPAFCAIAVACKHGNGDKPKTVIASRSRLYVVNKAGTATRYILPTNAVRELVSFDRGAGFTPGTYLMRHPSPTTRLGTYTPGKKRGKGTQEEPTHRPVIHGIRTSMKEY